MQPGGQLTITSEVENFPGYPKGASGLKIMEDIREQCLHAGTRIEDGQVTRVDFSSRPFVCEIDGGKEVEADTVIVATGATAKWLGIESEQYYRGYGVSTCATCDGAFFVGKDVAVIGGGDTALEEALYLSQRCRKVYIVHRRDQLRACEAYTQRMAKKTNIEVCWNCQPVEIMGEKKGFSRQVTGLKMKNILSGNEQVIAVEGVFVAIGVTPVTQLFQDQLELDTQGYIVTRPCSQSTNIEGVFAAGDVQDPHFRQAITAAASGCKAAIEAERFLNMFS
jgi:thioredoxin reductase (NADPH)